MSRVYQAPMPVLAVFYGLLAVWSVICVGLLNAIFEKWGSAGALQLFMIGFVLFYTWYFSLAICYRVELRGDGALQLTSLRRTVRANAEEIPLVEAPRFGLGLIRFRLEREKAYLFCRVNNASMREILSTLKEMNPDMKFKNLLSII